MVIKLGLLRGIEGSGIMSSEFLEVTGSVERRGCKTGFFEGAPLIMGSKTLWPGAEDMNACLICKQFQMLSSPTPH